jgi:hypothetical protein
MFVINNEIMLMGYFGFRFSILMAVQLRIHFVFRTPDQHGG